LQIYSLVSYRAGCAEVVSAFTSVCICSNSGMVSSQEIGAEERNKEEVRVFTRPRTKERSLQKCFQSFFSKEVTMSCSSYNQLKLVCVQNQSSRHSLRDCASWSLCLHQIKRVVLLVVHSLDLCSSLDLHRVSFIQNYFLVPADHRTYR
jgi:hypothetical protein